MSQHCPDKVPFAMRRRRMGDQAPSGCSDPPSRIWHRGSAPAGGAAAVPGTVGPVTQGWWGTDGATQHVLGRARARDPGGPPLPMLVSGSVGNCVPGPQLLMAVGPGMLLSPPVQWLSCAWTLLGWGEPFPRLVFTPQQKLWESLCPDSPVNLKTKKKQKKYLLGAPCHHSPVCQTWAELGGGSTAQAQPCKGRTLPCELLSLKAGLNLKVGLSLKAGLSLQLPGLGLCGCLGARQPAVALPQVGRALQAGPGASTAPTESFFFFEGGCLSTVQQTDAVFLGYGQQGKVTFTLLLPSYKVK